MSPDYRERLDALGFVWNSLTTEWERAFAPLQSFASGKGIVVCLKSMAKRFPVRAVGQQSTCSR